MRGNIYRMLTIVSTYCLFYRKTN